MAVRRLWPFWVWGEAGEGFVALRVLRECETITNARAGIIFP
jgi:hypothetical protein